MTTLTREAALRQIMLRHCRKLLQTSADRLLRLADMRAPSVIIDNEIDISIKRLGYMKILASGSLIEDWIPVFEDAVREEIAGASAEGDPQQVVNTRLVN